MCFATLGLETPASGVYISFLAIKCLDCLSVKDVDIKSLASYSNLLSDFVCLPSFSTVFAVGVGESLSPVSAVFMPYVTLLC